MVLVCFGLGIAQEGQTSDPCFGREPLSDRHLSIFNPAPGDENTHVSRFGDLLGHVFSPRVKRRFVPATSPNARAGRVRRHQVFMTLLRFRAAMLVRTGMVVLVSAPLITGGETRRIDVGPRVHRRCPGAHARSGRRFFGAL